MSHYSLAVRLPGRLRQRALEDVLAEALVPYQEHACTGKCPEKYLAFHDVEDEHLTQYQTESTEMVRLPSGELVYPWDDRFRVKGSTGLGAHSHKVPDDLLPLVEVKHTDRYATFEIFMEDYCSFSTRDAKTGRYGYWENPNAFWDWWIVGGRWRGQIPVKEGVHEAILGEMGVPEKMARRNGEWKEEDEPEGVDALRIRSIDFDQVAEQTRAKLVENWDAWAARVARGHRSDPKDPWDNARDVGLTYGFVECFDLDADKEAIAERVAKGWNVHPWRDDERPHTRDSTRCDVIAPVTEGEFKRLLAQAFSPLRTYAFLDPELGWVAPGKMGWWGHSSDSPDSKIAYVEKFNAWIRSGDSNDWFVIVDCHT